MSSAIVILNGLVVRKMAREREGFYKICLNKAVANMMIGFTYAIWSVPCSLLNDYYLPNAFNIFFGQVVGWGPYLMSAPFTQICLAGNRSVAISYPYWYSKQHRLPYTQIVLAALWTVSICLSLPALIDGCHYLYYPEAISWSPTNTECAITLSGYFAQAVVLMTCISFSVNVSNIIRVAKMSVGSNVVMTQNVSAIRKRNRRRMFIQCVIQDFTHTIDTITNTYIYTIYDIQWFQFLCGSVSVLTAISLDGLIMSVLHKKSNTPSVTLERLSKSNTLSRSRSVITTVL